MVLYCSKYIGEDPPVNFIGSMGRLARVHYDLLFMPCCSVLAEFQSRKAHRVHIRDRDLLKQLLLIILVTIGCLSTWTASHLDYLTHNYTNTTLIHKSFVNEYQYYAVCRETWSDYVLEAGKHILCLKFLTLVVLVGDFNAFFYF